MSNSKNLILPKRGSYTGYVRRNWLMPDDVERMIASGNMSPYIGALPHVLRARVKKYDISSATKQFRIAMDNFLVEKKQSLQGALLNSRYDLENIADIFDTECLIRTFVFSPDENARTWVGKSGNVAKLSFPNIGADFGLKIFFDNVRNTSGWRHGPVFENCAAFHASKVRPRENNPVFMASMGAVPYLMSLWGGDAPDGVHARKGKNKIFYLSSGEDAFENYRGGRLIDFGGLNKTVYGDLNYRARKLYRTFENLCMSDDFEKFKHVYKSHLSVPDFQSAASAATLVFSENIRLKLIDFMCRAAEYYRVK